MKDGFISSDAVVHDGVVYAWGDQSWTARFPASSALGIAIVEALEPELAAREIPWAVAELIAQADAIPLETHGYIRRADLEHAVNAVLPLGTVGIDGVRISSTYVMLAVGLAQGADDVELRVAKLPHPTEAGQSCAVVRGADWVQVIAPTIRVVMSPGGSA